MCNATEPVLASFLGTPNDTEKVISGTSGKRIILLRFNDASQQCTGTSSKSQLSCYIDPDEWSRAREAAVKKKTLRVHGKNGFFDISNAGWSEL